MPGPNRDDFPPGPPTRASEEFGGFTAWIRLVFATLTSGVLTVMSGIFLPVFFWVPPLIGLVYAVSLVQERYTNDEPWNAAALFVVGLLGCGGAFYAGWMIMLVTHLRVF
jgi:hypothetical protein